jgi:hypothetical protein
MHDTIKGETNFCTAKTYGFVSPSRQLQIEL